MKLEIARHATPRERTAGATRLRERVRDDPRAGPDQGAKARIAVSALVACLATTSLCAHAAQRCYKAESLKDAYGKSTGKPIEPVCLALEKNLNEFCDEPPMVCKLKIHPRHANELALPQWEPVDLGGSLRLLEELIRTPYASAPDPTAAERVWQTHRPGIEAASKEGRLSVSTAMLDLFQTGTKSRVYSYDLGDCAQKNPFLKASDEHGAWEVALKSPEIWVNLSPSAHNAMARHHYFLASGALGGQVFLFRGKTFTYSMLGFWRQGENPDLPPTNEVRVNQGSNFLLNGKSTIHFRNVCALNYQPARYTK